VLPLSVGLGVAVGMYPSALEQAARNAEELGKKLVKSIRGELKYPDQDEMHRQTTEYFCQLVKSDKERFAHDYDWYVQQGLDKIRFIRRFRVVQLVTWG